MKKLSLVLAVLMAVAAVSFAQTTIFSDNMTNFPTGWTLSPATGWVKSATSYNSASYSARCDEISPYAASQNNYMTRTVSLSGYTSATLKFYIWQYTESGYDYVYLQYYSGSTWTTAWSRAGSYQSWAQQTVTIPVTATQIRFWFKSDASVQNTGAYIDDVVLTGIASSSTPTLAISSTSWSPAAAGGTSSAISVTNSGTTSVIAYTVASNQTWLTVSSASGNTPGSFTMTAASNSGAARSATVTVTAAGVAGSPKTITVSQAAASGSDTYEPNGTSATAYGPLISATTYNSYIYSNGDIDYYKINVTATGTVTVTLTNLPGDYDLYLYNSAQTQVGSGTNGSTTSESISYSATTTGDYYIKVIGYNGVYSTTVAYALKAIFPSGAATPTLAISSTSWSPAAAGGTSSAINVTNSGTASVIAYTVASDQTWLTVSAASGNTPGSFTMTAASNSGAARSATVTVTAAGVAGSPKTITISQAAAATPTLAISSTSWAPAAAGGTSSAINVTNSGTASVIAYTVASNQTWLTVSAASGNTPGSFTMTAATNSGVARSATVTVTAAGVAGSPKTITVSQAGTGGGGYEWTVLVYLNADNNLEPYGISDFAEMAAASYSSGKVRVIVQMDRNTGYDATNGNWTSCKRFLITSGMTPIAANQISDLGEVDMGNPQTLADFVKWGIQNYPANHYFVDIWNHGGGYSKDGGAKEGGVMKDFSNDEQSGNGISVANGEFASAMNQIQTQLGGGKLDILAWDCCLMGMWEVLDIAKNYANTSVVSEETEGGDGWYYTNFLNSMNSTPTLAAIDVCKAVINGTSGLDTHSAIDLAQIPALTTKVNALADVLMAARPGASAQISTALTNTQKFSTSYFTYFIDLADFATKIKAQNISTAVNTACDELISANTAAVKLYKNATAYAAARGISIYHCNAAGTNYDTAYNGLPVVANTHWDEYIKGGSTGGGGTTANYTKSAATYSWDASATTASGLTGDDQSVNKPIGFTFNFYGTNYTTANICSNGFLSFSSTSTAYSPAAIPSTADPNAMIAGLWRDLNVSGGGTITYYSSATKFVVSYNAVKNYSNTSTQTFQIILTPDGKIKMQWGSITTAESYGSGVENQAGSVGVSATAAASSAALYTPPASWSSPAEDDPAAARLNAALIPAATLLAQNTPNPVYGKTLISYQLVNPGQTSIKIYNINGQLVKTLVNGPHASGTHSVVWDARDQTGNKVAAGIYVYKLTNSALNESRRMIVVK